MINATKRYYKNKNKNETFISKTNQIELVASMLKNNLKDYLIFKTYKTSVNPKIDELINLNKIQKYIESLDYLSTLYFYSSCILELVLYENNLLENNKEIKSAYINAKIIKELISTNDYEHKLCSNFYVEKTDLKNVVLNVFCDLYDNTKIKDVEKINPILLDFLNCYENNFESKLSPVDIFNRLIDLKNNSVLVENLESGIDKLNKQIDFSGGVLNNARIDKSSLDETIFAMSKIIGHNEIENHYRILKDNLELYSLTDYVVELNMTDEIINTNLDLGTFKE